MDVYFVRANGESAHADPQRAEAYVERATSGRGARFNDLSYCLRAGFAALAGRTWAICVIRPKTRSGRGRTLTGWADLDPKHRRYLEEFAAIAVGDLVLVPDPDRSGLLYAGQVDKPYHYLFGPPEPYEAAHRVGVAWIGGSSPRTFYAKKLSIQTAGGWWRGAFHRLDAEASGRGGEPRPRLLTQTAGLRPGFNDALP